MSIQAQHDQGVYIKDIAQKLGVSAKTVSRALSRGSEPKGMRRRTRQSKLEPFKAKVDELLSNDVWNAEVIYRVLKEQGYPGRTTILRNYIHPKRPLRQKRMTVRFETRPGKQLQNDWGQTTCELAGRAQKIHFNVNTLGFSRRFHFWCCDRNDAEHTYEGLIRSFEYFGGLVAEVLVDNQKATVIRNRIGQTVQFNERFIDLAGHYGFTPRACRPYRARTKGKDERMVGYIKHNFFVRYRQFDSFAHLNQLAEKWLREEADQRVHGTVKQVVSERFAQEAAHLQPLAAVRYDTSYRGHRFAHWDGYIDVRGNRYSVPSELCGRHVAIRIHLDDRLSVYADDALVVEHRLRRASEGWVTIGAHHQKLWSDAFAVERRDLSAYEEVA